MNKDKYDQLKTMKKIKDIIKGKKDEPLECTHVWRLCFASDKYIWYCVRCRKIEDYKVNNGDS